MSYTAIYINYKVVGALNHFENLTFLILSSYENTDDNIDE